jgi:1-(5-phosphoribosyl)-5-[(5-phosphoribosylamino)methylideneamino] imidazole-4-carboxamide isomerase/N-(5'phosphoribosyl)anthranilate isomerase
MSGLRLLPAVDIRDGRAVRLVQGRADAETVYDDDPVTAARRWIDQGSDWLHVVDLDAAFGGDPRNRHLIADICEATGAKVQASGGIRTLEDLRHSIGYGAERVVVGTMALEDPGFVAAALDAFGERVVVGLDADGTTLRARGWTQDGGDLWAVLDRLTVLGVRRFVFTDIARDGKLGGPNLERLTLVADPTTARVTASGGGSSLDDLERLAAVHDGVDEVFVGQALYAGHFSVTDALALVGDPA